MLARRFARITTSGVSRSGGLTDFAICFADHVELLIRISGGGKSGKVDSWGV